MEVNLQEQYLQVEKIIGEFQSFISKSLWRAIAPFSLIKIIILLLRPIAITESGISEKDRSRLMIKRITEILYSEDERKNPFYEIGLGPNSLHKLSCFIEQKYPDISFEHLLTVHKMPDVGAEVPKPGKLFGLVFASGSIFSKTVPQPIIESFNISYIDYQIYTFWAFVLALVYCSIIVAMFYPTYRVRKLSREVLEYTSARIKARSSNKSIQPTADASAD